MVLVEQPCTFLQSGELVAVDQRHAGAEAFGAGAVAGSQRDGADAIEEQVVQQLLAGESRIREGEIEPVGNLLFAIVVVHNLEAVVGEDFLHTKSR